MRKYPLDINIRIFKDVMADNGSHQITLEAKGKVDFVEFLEYARSVASRETEREICKLIDKIKKSERLGVK